MSNRKPKQRRPGPDPLPPDQQRQHRFSVYVTEIERAEIERRAKKTGMRPPAYLREAGLTRLPPSVPEINREAWASLARVAANLNQYQAAIHAGRAQGYPPEVLKKLYDLVQQLRLELSGVSHEGES